MNIASLSVLDPTLIDEVRDQLADDFARRIFGAIPDVSDCVEFEAEACSDAKGKQRFLRASQLLYSRGRDLQSQAAVVVRRIFDEKLAQLLEGAARSGRLSLNGMTLLADERLDEEIAISHCSRRLKEQCEFELWGLTQRIAILTAIDHPADRQNPVYPHTFVQALMEAIGSLESDAEVRLAVFKTFGPVLLDIIPAVFAAANTALTARGIDVESNEYYGRPVITPERQSAPVSSQDELAIGSAKANLALTSVLAQILAKSASASPFNPEPTLAFASKKPLTAAVHLSVVPSGQAAVPGWHGDAGGPTPGYAGEATNLNAGGRAKSGDRLTLEKKLVRDAQMIGEVITVMFEQLLTNPRMPFQLREIVARLQLPVLEAATKDRSLLTQVNHPVRKLIDLIAEFGLTLGLGDDDASTVRSVESIVDGLVQIHNVEPNAFKLAFERLDDFFYHHEEAALQTDNDLRTLERQETAEFAGKQVDREIAIRMQNLVLPRDISAFILTAWREVLVGNYLKGGQKGDPWKLGLATLDDIVKSLSQATGENERRRLAATLPASIAFMLNATDAVSDDDAVAANFFAGLHRAHDLAIAGNWVEIGGERMVPTPAALLESANISSPSATLASLGLACGDWIETRDAAGTRRWRLNWITTILGTCVFKHYESNTTRNMSCEELRERLLSGEVQQVCGLGLVNDVLKIALETVSRNARREDARLTVQVPNSMDHVASPVGTTYQRGTSTLFL